MTLCYFYPSWMLVWQVLVALDISSHWIQMYASLKLGKTSHKLLVGNNPLLTFYNNPVCMDTRVSKYVELKFLCSSIRAC